MIEDINQVAHRYRQRLAMSSDLRERAANALLGGARKVWCSTITACSKAL